MFIYTVSFTYHVIGPVSVNFIQNWVKSLPAYFGQELEAH